MSTYITAVISIQIYWKKLIMRNIAIKHIIYFFEFVLLVLLFYCYRKCDFQKDISRTEGGITILHHSVIPVVGSGEIYVLDRKNNIGKPLFSTFLLARDGTYMIKDGKEVYGTYTNRLESNGTPVVVQIAGRTNEGISNVEVCVSGNILSMELSNKPKEFCFLIENGTTSGDFYISKNINESDIIIEFMVCVSYEEITDFATGIYDYTY